VLDLHVQDYLESNLPREEFLKVKDECFYRRVELIKERGFHAGDSAEQVEAFEPLWRRLGPLRKLRNHIGHGVLRYGLAPDKKNSDQTLSVARDLDGSSSSDALHLDFADLESTLNTLNELIKEFQRLPGFKETKCATIVEDLKGGGEE
jgi:hypothetical protein